MVLRSGVVFATTISLVASGLLAGCLWGGSDPSPTGQDGLEGLHFTWSPTRGDRDSVVMINVTAGPETSCTYESKRESYSGSPHGLSSYTFWRDEHWALQTISMGHIVFSGSHAGSASSGQLTHDLGSGLSWGTTSYEFDNGSYMEHLMADFNLYSRIHDRNDYGPWVEVHCDSRDALVRFHEADDFAVIYTPFGEGGVGASVFDPNYVGNTNIVPTLEVNHGDSWSIDTAGQYVHLGSHAFNRRSGPVLDPYHTGQIVLSTPGGEEEVPFDNGRFFGLHRAYEEDGTYGLHLERVAVGYSAYAGLLAGFLVTEEIGDLVVADWQGPVDHGSR